MVYVSWVMPGSVRELMLRWKNGARRRNHKAWNVTFLALMWVVWKEGYRELLKRLEMSFAHLSSL